MVTDKKSGFSKPDFFNSKTILNLLYFSILRRVSCFRPYKYTNFKAIHNDPCFERLVQSVVFDPTNIQILKQFTTIPPMTTPNSRCFRPYKYTNFKAIHNYNPFNICFTVVVFDPTNIQILKQFTTHFGQP